MSIRRLVWHGEAYVAMTEAAAWYGIEVHEIEMWVHEELLESPHRVEGVPALPASQLDRIATLVRCTRVLGLEVDVIRMLLV